jgi:hypothetical protein
MVTWPHCCDLLFRQNTKAERNGEAKVAYLIAEEQGEMPRERQRQRKKDRDTEKETRK